MSSCIPGQFIDILKKTEHIPSRDVVLDVKTAADYEILRNYATGGETHDGIEVELAVFITHGVTAWLHPYRQGCSQGRVKPERSERDEGRWLLAVLLANMIESRGGI